MMKQLLRGSMLFLAMLVIAAPSFAQPYPNKPITVIFGFPPGTLLDVMIRSVGAEMTKRLGQPIVIDYRPGANGTIGARYVAGSKPDGYTLFYSNMVASHPLFNLSNGVDPGKEMAPVANFANAPYVLVSRATLPFTSLQELIAYSKANPGSLKFGSPSDSAFMLLQLLKAKTGVTADNIPYKGIPQILTALLAGDIDLSASSAQGYLGQIQEGKIRALLVMSPNRYSVLPTTLTAAAAGYPDLQKALINYQLWAPLGTRRDITQKLSAEAVRALKLPAVIEQYKGLGTDVDGTTPEGLMRIYESEIKFWSELARLADYRPQ